jgi:AcrR family transcriptional regulator
MSRWPPDTSARLKTAALALFDERGFANVTAAEIAACAGMTERTFFRHFKAKDEVLFEDYAGVKAELTSAIVSAPEGTSARALLTLIAEFLSNQFQNDRDLHRALLRVVASDATLRTRALQRDHEWGAAVTEGFTRRGYTPLHAEVLAGVTTAMFRIIYIAWASDHRNETLAERFEVVQKNLLAALS